MAIDHGIRRANMSKFYLPLIYLAASRTKQHFCLRNFSFSASQFRNILAAARHCSDISFESCLLETEVEVNFKSSLAHSKISSLNFEGSGSSRLSDWADQPWRLNNIFKGLSKVSTSLVFLSLIFLLKAGVNCLDSVDMDQ